MRVSLNWIKKYVKIPKDITDNKIAYDLTMRTVEVENVIHTAEKYHDIVVGKILEIKDHPNADSLKVCIVDIGLENPVQIVCGGSNLYVGEGVVVSKPGAQVVWHGEGEPVLIKETKMRGEDSFGMICASAEVFLDSYFPSVSEKEIIDLKGYEINPGQNIADLLGLNDTVLEIDNKSLTNRPDLWGHYGIARELSAIYNLELNSIPKFEIPKNLPEYKVTIQNEEKCNRYAAVKIDDVNIKPSPIWMQNLIINAGMRPINAIVDITNYVMLATGQPTHAFDSTHVTGEHIIVRNAQKNETLTLLDDNNIELDEEDLVVCDEVSPLALAGIKGGKKDSILDSTTSILLEVANFSATSIRKTDKKFAEKTDAAIRFEKGIDTQRVDEGLNLALSLFKEIFPESKITAINDVYPKKTLKNTIEVAKEFLTTRLGKDLDDNLIKQILGNLGYEYSFENDVYKVVTPTWRSTGDVSIKDDVMGDIARILSYETFEAKPLPINFTSAVNAKNATLERKTREYLAFKCGFNEIFTYPWVDEKYIKASKINVEKAVTLDTPPAPELSILRTSLIPGMLEVISKNLRYFNSFKLFEQTECYENGEYHPSSEKENLPVQNKYLTGAIVGSNPEKLFFEAKGAIQNMARNIHMEDLSFAHNEKPVWADQNGYLNVMLNDEKIGDLGLLSVGVMSEAKIKRVNVAIFEINSDKFIPLDSRENKYEKISELPLIEKDLSLLLDEKVSWEDIVKVIGKKVKSLEFIEEYRGSQIPEGKKSYVIKLKIENTDVTMTSEEINKKINSILKSLEYNLGIKLREE